MFNQYPIILVCLVQTVRLVKLESLRVEFLLKTDSGYPRDAEVTLFTLANPGSSLRFNTHLSAPPVSALARSEGFFLQLTSAGCTQPFGQKSTSAESCFFPPKF